MQEKLVELFATHLPPLKQVKDPATAAVIAVLTGGFGLALFLRSWIDAVVVAAAIFTMSAVGAAPGALTILAALAHYGFTRVEASNRQLQGRAPGEPAPVTT